MSALALLVLSLIAAIVCLRVSGNVEGRGTFLFWAGIVFIVIAIILGISQVKEILDLRDDRPYSTMLELN